MTKSMLIYTPFFFNFLILLVMSIPMKINNLHPLTMMIMLFLITSITALKMNYLFKSWLSFILFITVIGGLMIIFMYITSLASNNMFNFKYKIIYMNMIKLIPILLILMYLIFNSSNWFTFNSNLENTWNSPYLNMWDQENMISLYKIFFNKSCLFIMIYLYYTMICIMNICLKFKAPLRQNLIYE